MTRHSRRRRACRSIRLRSSGSINLKGGRIDDLRLKGYRETVAKDSPTVILLSPSGGPDGYFAEFGWVGAPAGTNVPGPDTIWTAPEGAKLTPDTPVALTYDNGAGLTFKRIISIDPSYMFTVRDEVTNATGAALTLSPYGRGHAHRGAACRRLLHPS